MRHVLDDRPLKDAIGVVPLNDFRLKLDDLADVEIEWLEIIAAETEEWYQAALLHLYEAVDGWIVELQELLCRVIAIGEHALEERDSVHDHEEAQSD